MIRNVTDVLEYEIVKNEATDESIIKESTQLQDYLLQASDDNPGIGSAVIDPILFHSKLSP